MLSGIFFIYLFYIREKQYFSIHLLEISQEIYYHYFQTDHSLLIMEHHQWDSLEK